MNGNVLRANIGAGGPADRRAVLKKFLPQRSVFLGVAFLSGVTNLLMLTAPLFMLQVYDRVIPSGSFPTLLTLFALVAALYLAQSIIDYCRGRVLARLGESLDETLVARLFNVDLDQSIREPGTRNSSLNELGILRRFLSGVGPGALLDAPWIPIYLLILASLHWVLGLLGLLGAIVVIVLAVLADITTRSNLMKSSEIDANAQRLLASMNRAAETAKVLGMSERLSRRYAAIRGEGIEAEAGSGNTGARFASFSKGFRMFLQSATLAAGAALAIGQEVSGGAIVAASIILGRALAPIDQIVGHWRSISQARNALRQIVQTLEEKADLSAPMSLPPPLGYLKVEGLVTGPPGSRTPVLSGVNFELKPGDGLGVIGPSASGKSTLARALVGVTTPLAGEIRLDGATLDQWTPEALGRHVGYLPQDVDLFEGTVAECISRHDPNAHDENILRAAKAAGAHDMILALPEGYGNLVGEGGAILSGGQRQRIALARALYGDPALIVLDEPNANLDQEGDAALTHAIHSARERGATVIVITHRPSAVAAVDQILVLKDGAQAGFDKREIILRQVLRVADEEPKERTA